jgi:riboflavin synthase
VVFNEVLWFFLSLEVQTIGIIKMFSGIVHNCYQVIHLERKEGFIAFSVAVTPELTEKLYIGASVSIDGVCLTVTRIDAQTISFDVIGETIRATNLKNLVVHDWVNVELSLTADHDVSGHIVSGHVDGTVTIEVIEQPDENNYTLTFSAEERLMKYIFAKGYIALNGCSLTVGVVERDKNSFSVYLIPETLRRTNLKNKNINDQVNVEVERQTQAIVDTVNDFLGKLAANSLSDKNSLNILNDLMPDLLSKLKKNP